MKKNIFFIPAFFILATLFEGCGPSTQIVNSWRDPEVVVHTNELHKFVVAALLKNESVRRATEDKMASFNPGKAIPSYQIFGTTVIKESDEYYMNKLKQEGYDGIVILRLTKVDKDSR